MHTLSACYKVVVRLYFEASLHLLVTLHNRYNAVRFDRAIQRWILSLPI